MAIPLLGPLFASLTSSLARLIPSVAKGAEATASASQITWRAFTKAGAVTPQMMVQGLGGNRGSYAAPAPGNPSRDMRTAEQRGADATRYATANPESPFRAPSQPSWFQNVAQGLMDRVVVTPSELGKTAGWLGKSALAPHEQAGAAGGFAVKEGLGLAAAFTKLQQPLTPFAERLRDISNELIEAKRNLSEYNGTYAQAFAKLDVARERGNIETARLTSGSTSFLIDQQIALEKALRPLLASVENVKNASLAVLIQATLQILEQIKFNTEILGKIFDKIPGVKSFKELVADLEKANEGAEKNASATIMSFIERIGRHATSGGDPLRPPLPWGQQFNGGRR